MAREGKYAHFCKVAEDEVAQDGVILRAHGISVGDTVSHPKVEEGVVTEITRHYNGKFDYYIYFFNGCGHIRNDLEVVMIDDAERTRKARADALLKLIPSLSLAVIEEMEQVAARHGEEGKK